MTEPLIAFLARAELLMERIEAALPHALVKPDRTPSIAFG